MRLNELLTESQVQEGPLLNKLGSTVGKAAGTVAKGVGAVAGGIAGIGKAFKKGYQAGKTTVGSGGDSDSAEPAAANTGSAASSTGSAPSGSSTAAPATTSKPAATTTTPAAQSKPAQATSKPAAAPAQSSEQPAAKAANDTQYAQAQKAIAALQPADQKTILTTLQADPKVKSAMAKAAQPQQKQSAAAPAAEPTAAPATTAPAATTTEPNKPVKKGGRKKAAGPSQAEIDADRARIMGPTSDSVIRTGKSIVENISEAGLMAKLGSKVGQAAQTVGNVAGKNVGAMQQAKADPEHAKNLVKAFATGDTSKDPNNAEPIQDKSGTVPKQIIDKINQLNLEQRAELHKLITQKTL
jgi:hypothetical protein